MKNKYYWTYSIDRQGDALAISTIDKKERTSNHRDVIADAVITKMKDISECGYTNRISTEQMESLLINLGAKSMRLE